MKPHDVLDRAALVLGIVSIASALVPIRERRIGGRPGRRSPAWRADWGWACCATPAVGPCPKAWTSIFASGICFLVAAGVQLSLLAKGNGGFLGGNASTFSALAGPGFLAHSDPNVPRPEPAQDIAPD